MTFLRPNSTVTDLRSGDIAYTEFTPVITHRMSCNAMKHFLVDLKAYLTENKQHHATSTIPIATGTTPYANTAITTDSMDSNVIELADYADSYHMEATRGQALHLTTQRWRSNGDQH